EARSSAIGRGAGECGVGQDVACCRSPTHAGGVGMAKIGSTGGGGRLFACAPPRARGRSPESMPGSPSARSAGRSISGHSAEKGGEPMAITIEERALDGRLARLEAARPWSPRVISRLEALIRTAEDDALFRVNPLAFARQWDLDQSEAIDLFLHAAAAGLFEMDWLLICPR